jgi:septum formation protein
MLRLLAGRDHSVLSSVHVIAPDGRRRGATAMSRVAIAPLAEPEIAAYVATGEPLDKAGAYAIQGRAGEFSALRRGSLDTVVGLPVRHFLRVLRELDYQFPNRTLVGSVD